MTENKSALYAVVALGGNQWTIIYKKVTTVNSTTSGHKTGYGNYPDEDYPGVPVVRLDLVGFKTALKFTSIPDNVRPAEESDNYSGTLEEFLNQTVSLGIPVEHWDVRTRKPIHGALYYIIPIPMSDEELHNMAINHIVKITPSNHTVVRGDHINMLTRHVRGMEANTFNEWNFLQVVRNMPVERMKTLKLVI